MWNTTNRSRVILVVVAYEWPTDITGGGIALSSSIDCYSRYFDSIICLGCTDLDVTADVLARHPNVDFRKITVSKKKSSVRFIESLFSKWPAITHQFRSKSVVLQIEKALEEIQKCGKVKVVFEHSPLAAMISRTEAFEKVETIAIRSFDVLSLAFDGLSDAKSVMDYLWSLEIRKIRAMEKRLFEKVDFFWAISDQDFDDFESLGIQPAGCIGVSIDGSRYKNISNGSSKIAIYLGGVDVRKENGLRILVDEVWPKVLTVHPTAKLILGGRGTEVYGRKSKNIVGVGFVESEVEFLGNGSIFINPQTTGSGVKLKSLVAMSAGRTLISFENGVRGIGGENGVHFYCCETPEDMSKKIIHAMSECASELEGQKLISDMYSLDRLQQFVAPTLKQYLVHRSS